MRKFYYCILLVFFITQTVFAAKQTVAVLKLANVLQSNMVIQQGKPFKLWGTATAGQIITVTTDWAAPVTAKTNAAGNWIAQVNVPKVKPGNFTPHSITVNNGAETIKLTDVLIGEVWLCVGQSNMDMIVNEAMFLTYPGVVNYKEEIAAANFPAIRMYKVNAQFKIAPVADTKGSWVVCSPKTAGNFSGTAYFFGRELFTKLNVPVGLVVSAAPGASTQAFTKREVLTGDSILNQTYLAPQLQYINSQQKVDTTGFFSLVTKPVLLYNGNIYPLFNLSVKGIAYYQGESNARSDKRDVYLNLFGKMLADWRHDLKQGDLPFYFTEIAPYREANEDTLSYNAAYFRETQEQLLSLKNTGIAITLDAGKERNVHPPDKRSVGERLAKNALNKTYGLKDVQYLGPRFKKFKVEGNTIKITFDKKSLGSGLVTKDGKAPQYFFVAGDDKRFYPAEASITGNEIWLSNHNVSRPVAIRYAYTNWVNTNLQNKEGLPAMQFRTDIWE
jgi:sialate O-acetylesterase